MPPVTGVLNARQASAMPRQASRELEEDLRPLRIAEVEAVGDAQRHRAGAGDVARRLRHRGLAALVRDRAPAAGCCSPPSPPGRSRSPRPGARRRRRPGPSRVRGLHGGVVLLEHPALAGDGRLIEQQLAARRGGRPWPPRSAPAAPQRLRRVRSPAPPGGRSARRRPAAGPGISATVTPSCRIRYSPSSVTRPIGVASSSHLRAHRLDRRHPVRLGHDQHPLLRFARA